MNAPARIAYVRALARRRLHRPPPRAPAPPPPREPASVRIVREWKRHWGLDG